MLWTAADRGVRWPAVDGDKAGDGAGEWPARDTGRAGKGVLDLFMTASRIQWFSPYSSQFTAMLNRLHVIYSVLSAANRVHSGGVWRANG